MTARNPAARCSVRYPEPATPSSLVVPLPRCCRDVVGHADASATILEQRPSLLRDAELHLAALVLSTGHAITSSRRPIALRGRRHHRRPHHLPRRRAPASLAPSCRRCLYAEQLRAPAPPAHLPHLELPQPRAVASREPYRHCNPPQHRNATALIVSASKPTTRTRSTSPTTSTPCHDVEPPPSSPRHPAPALRRRAHDPKPALRWCLDVGYGSQSRRDSSVTAVATRERTI